MVTDRQVNADTYWITSDGAATRWVRPGADPYVSMSALADATQEQLTLTKSVAELEAALRKAESYCSTMAANSDDVVKPGFRVARDYVRALIDELPALNQTAATPTDESEETNDDD